MNDKKQLEELIKHTEKQLDEYMAEHEDVLTPYLELEQHLEMLGEEYDQMEDE